MVPQQPQRCLRVQTAAPRCKPGAWRQPEAHWGLVHDICCSLSPVKPYTRIHALPVIDCWWWWSASEHGKVNPTFGLQVTWISTCQHVCRHTVIALGRSSWKTMAPE